jgi:hypothetical protein
MADKPKGTKKTGAKKPAPQEKVEKESKEQQPLTVCSATAGKVLRRSLTGR